MSSSPKAKRYKVALFVHGLASNPSFFDEAFKKLVNQGNAIVKEYSGVVDMSNFNTTTSKFMGISDGSLLPTSGALKTFSLTIAEIVDLAKANPNKTILVKTKLDHRPIGISDGSIIYKPYDSIENQSARLTRIINAIKELDNSIEIILVGHSQGGLVNLASASEIPDKISQIISVSTPYSSVSSANLLKDVEYAANLINLSVLPYLDIKKEDYGEYKKRIDALSNPGYFSALKSKWNNLPSRPNLTVIAGISSHFMTSEYYFFFVPIEVNHRYPFDGLVLGREMVDIENADIHVLHKEGVECYQESDGFKHSCCSRIGLMENHVCNCPLPCLDVASLIIKTGLATLQTRMNNGKVSFDDLPEIKALIDGKNNKEDYDRDYRQYYEVMDGNYSHRNTIREDDCIGLLLGIFAK